MADSSPNARLTIKTGTDSGKVVELGQGELVIGRSAPAGLIINHPEVSRRHARLVFQQGNYLLEDLGSSNGTFVNGQQIRGAHQLENGAEIQLGSQVRLLFSQPPAEGRTVVQTSAAGVQSLQGGQFDRTMVDSDLTAGAVQTSIVSEIPPTLLVTVAGQETRTYTLTKSRITLGRADDNDIVVASPIVSRHHATLERTSQGYEIHILPGVINTLTCQGVPVKERQLLNHADVLRIDSELPGMMVSMTYQAPSQATTGISAIQFGDKEKLTFGRDPGNDIILDNPRVSRFHALVTRVGRRYYVTDLRSSNGTFVNDQRVQGNVWLNPQDTIRIGPYKLVMGQDQFTRYDETEGLRVEAYHLNKWVRKDLNLLQDISLVYQPREFIVVVGQSGGGKSTLLDAIAGYRPATQGKVFVNGTDVYQNFDAVRNEIGYVPQRDIIHMELTVYQALDFAAQLRMPKDTSKDERHKRIMEVLNDLDLTHRKDVQVSGLSGGQQKRVSIGVELLTRPGLFFLDEPTSGLDPGTETAFMHLMRRLADQGRTIVMVTHATKNVMLADKVVFLARGGHVAWFGPPDEALKYFDQYRSDQDRRTRDMEFDQIYAILDDSSKGKGKDWGERYMASKAFSEHIVEPLKSTQQQVAAAQAEPVKKQARKGARISSFRQFLVLSARNVTILLRDRSALTLMLAAPVGVGALSIVLAFVMGRNAFQYKGGDPGNAGITLFLLSLFALLVGGMSQMREFVKEADIYRRERLVNLRIIPYVTSKVWVAMVLALWHALAYVCLHYLAFKMPGGLLEFGEVYVTLVLAVITGMMLGLFASALAANAASAPLTLIMLIVPLIVLSGILAPVPNAVSQIASTRWAFQSIIGISGMGSDVAADSCWQLDEKLRDGMDLAAKDYFNCKCMGTQIFDQNSCNFPGTGDYYTAEINQMAPIEPAALPEQPPEPVIPEAPTLDASKTYDQVAIAQYLNSLKSYQDDVKNIQDNYRNQMTLYQVQADIYKNKMIKYQEDRAKYEVARISAVNTAEGNIKGIIEKYGWAFVNKSDPKIYFPWLFKTWFAQVEIVAVYYVIILILIKRKDVK
jgi:ABC-type multidrug transport system ATPase subunit/pSer/pThr/pTyr-binding forkhead associated (FHA) protein